MEAQPIVTVNNLKTYFYTNQRCNKAINGVSFQIKKGKTLCVVGESGCGKSVTASSIMQLLPKLSRIEEGEIIYHGDEGDVRIDQLKRNGREMRSLRGQDIAMIFQDPMTALNPVYTIGFQIMENIRNHQKVSKKEARLQTLELLKQMGIPFPEKRIDEYPHQFSGGMRQRAMIAMAMSCSPKVLIADEPTTALDVTIQAQIFELMDKLKTEHETAILLITHDMGVVSELADDVAVMYMGNIIESGSVDDVLRYPAHPYTQALLRSIPILGKGKDQDLQPIKGSTPDPFNRPIGCQFAPRCDFACEKCNQMPDESVIDGSHVVRCWRYNEVMNMTHNEKDILLQLKGVKTYFPIKSGLFNKTNQYVQAVNGIDLTIYKGETIGLVGESGCGKTTLGKSILQLVTPTDGEMIYDFGTEGRKDLRTLKAEEMNLARKKMQIVFQDPHSSLNPAFTIYQSLSDPLKKFGVKTKAERRQIIGDLLEAVNMRREYMDRYPHEFSGGQRQRIGIARALSINPELIICDEAVSALDVSIQAQVLNLLKDLKEKRHLTYIFITHDLSVVEYISDRIAVMYLGKIVELAPTNELFKHTLHPYTQALLSAIPVADLDKSTERIVLEGDVPSPVNPPSGCHFHERCVHCMEKCKVDIPALKRYLIDEQEHFVACHLVQEQMNSSQQI